MAERLRLESLFMRQLYQILLITLSGYLSRLCDTYEYGQALSTSETISDKIFVDLNVIVSNYRTPTKAEGTRLLLMTQASGHVRDK